MYVFQSLGTVRCLYSVVRELYPTNMYFSLLQIIYDIQLFAGALTAAEWFQPEPIYTTNLMT
jgi:hypothetical protein